MNPFLSNELATEHIRDLHHEAARAPRGRDQRDTPQSDHVEPVSIRRFTERDIDAVRLLAALDGKHVPTGGVLVAERAGEVVAAVPIDGGQALADPFQRTTEIVSLLRLRARQLSEASGTRGFPVALWNRIQARKLAV